jgi:hypothetical protein
MKKSNYSYIGIAFIILVFGIIFIPKIVTRFKRGTSLEQKVAVKMSFYKRQMQSHFHT